MPAMSITPLFAAAHVQVPAIAPDAHRQRLAIEHDDLDAAIDALALSGSTDDLIVTRLKKRKLRIKDEIAAVPSAARDMDVAQAS
jgi:hypothetical protein